MTGRVRAARTAGLLALVEPDERGEPMSPLRWTTKSTRHLADQLTRQGHRISADTVGDLLREEGFSLQGNAKTIEGRQHPDQDGQFRYINEQVKAHQTGGDPVVSVDTKKKGSSAPTRTAAGSGSAPANQSKSPPMTSLTRNWARRSRTASMALTLAESAKLSENDLQRGVIETFIQQSPILGRLPLISFDGPAYQYNEEAALPGVSFRGVYQAY